MLAQTTFYKRLAVLLKKEVSILTVLGCDQVLSRDVCTVYTGTP